MILGELQQGDWFKLVVDIVGWGAAALVLVSFYLKTMIALRIVAMASNVVFILYGFLAGAMPILVLHSLLLPLNATRLIQMKILIRKVKYTTYGNVWADMLIPYMSVRRVPAGKVIFQKGDFANTMYYVLKGRVRILGLDKPVYMGHIFGEMGIFTPEQKRTNSAVCETDVELASITQDKIWELIHQNPEFGVYLLKVVVQRVLEPSNA